MALRLRLLFWFITLIAISLILFGANSYHIAQDAVHESEADLFNRNTLIRTQLAEKILAHESSVQKIYDSLQSHTLGDSEIFLVLNSANDLIPSTNHNEAIRAFYSAWRQQYQSDAQSGSLAIDQNNYHWLLHRTATPDISFLTASKWTVAANETPKRLLLRLFSIATIVLWLMIWMILIVTHRVTKKLEDQSEALEKQAYRDALTGLPNRVYLLKVLNESIKDQKDSPGTAVLLVLDLDRFKEINDTLGHEVGDTVLKSVAERLQRVLWERDTIVRLSGDEFALLLPVADKSHCQLVIEKVIKVMGDPFQLHDITLYINITIGISRYPDDSTNPVELISHAEVAMYEAKHRKEPFLSYDHSIDPHSVERLTLASDLKHAAERNELYLCYQPLIDARTGRINSVEALVRWKSASRGLVMPDKFIPLAEHTGLIKSLTYHIIDLAAAQSANWKSRGINLKVAINLSARLVHDQNIPEIVRDTSHKYNIQPDTLEFEITETAIMLDPVRAIDVLSRLSAMGILLSVDDFGSGYTSLGFLKQIPVTTIKVDKSFVLNMLTDANDAFVVHAIIDLAHNMSRTVVAEGVETLEIYNALVGLSCDTVQGYYFSKPLPAQEFETWLHRYNADLTTDRSAGFT